MFLCMITGDSTMTSKVIHERINDLYRSCSIASHLNCFDALIKSLCRKSARACIFDRETSCSAASTCRLLFSFRNAHIYFRQTLKRPLWNFEFSDPRIFGRAIPRKGEGTMHVITTNFTAQLFPTVDISRRWSSINSAADFSRAWIGAHPSPFLPTCVKSEARSAQIGCILWILNKGTDAEDPPRRRRSYETGCRTRTYCARVIFIFFDRRLIR